MIFGLQIFNLCLLMLLFLIMEIDILKARLKYLENNFDYFIYIVESNSTFTGKPKNLILKNFINEKFDHLKKKILIYENNSVKVLCKEVIN